MLQKRHKLEVYATKETQETNGCLCYKKLFKLYSIDITPLWGGESV